MNFSVGDKVYRLYDSYGTWRISVGEIVKLPNGKLAILCFKDAHWQAIEVPTCPFSNGKPTNAELMRTSEWHLSQKDAVEEQLAKMKAEHEKELNSLLCLLPEEEIPEEEVALS